MVTYWISAILFQCFNAFFVNQCKPEYLIKGYTEKLCAVIFGLHEEKLRFSSSTWIGMFTSRRLEE